MSYILDSLKKSDQERKRGSVPDVLSEHGDGPESGPPPRRRWPILLGGGFLLLNGVAVALWLQPWQPAAPVAKVAETAPAPAAEEKTVQLAAAQPKTRARMPEPVAEPTPPAARTEVGEGGVAEPPAEEGAQDFPEEQTGGPEPQGGSGWQGRAPAEGENGQDEMNDAGPDAEEARPPAGPEAESGAESQAPVAPGAERQTRPVSEPRDSGPADETFSPEEEVAPDTAVPEAGPADRDDIPAPLPEPESAPRRHPGAAVGQPQAPPDVNQLPPAVRNGLPEIHISAHFYAKKPASRLVSVNGRILREGQEMDGLRVEEITPSGVIFVHRGRKFFMEVF